MRPSSFQKLTLLAIFVGHLDILGVARAFSIDRCGHHIDYFDPRYSGSVHDWRCTRRRMHMFDPCFRERSLCGTFPDFHDCLLPLFRCHSSVSCIPRSRYCNGIRDCNDGSDEWVCPVSDTTSSDSTTISTMFSESIEKTSSYIITTSTILQDIADKTTNVILPESEDITFSSPPPTSTFFPDSESNISPLLSAITSTLFPDSELNTAPLLSSSTTSTMISDSESNTAHSSSLSTTSTVLPDSESSTSSSSATITSMSFPDLELNTAPPSSTATSTMIPDSESNTSPSISTTTKTILPASRGAYTMTLESKENTSPLTTDMTLPDSIAVQSCPGNYCMQNAECIVVQGQYRCNCPSSFIGEHCEIKLGTEQGSYEYAVAIAISMTLVILCVSVVSVCIYRCKRSSAWKYNDRTYRTLSQLTLASNDVE